ncbi:hypothetical protein Sjap_018311 [Stephania japonica]|uniref:Uncharacterized protein n=1 Tax=Stephania japonica TaxID=461633 RepID=A0AAP0I8I8_9MAGN
MRVDSLGRERVRRDWSSIAERRQLRHFGSGEDDSFVAAGAMTTVEEMSDDDDNFAFREDVVMTKRRQLREGMVMKKRRQLSAGGREGVSGNGDWGFMACFVLILWV